MEQAAPYVIETCGLSKQYKGVTALNSLDLKVPKHSIFGFLGPNGAGKTTTIKLILGLAKPTGGRVSVFGKDCVLESEAVRRRIGYLAQDPRFYEHMTARETLRFTAKFFYAGPNKEIEDRVEETLSLVGLTDKADRPIKGFSGGERQRLGIGQAQINYPDLLILDEPAASLDPMGRHDVLEVMDRLRKHTTIFYSTHILSDVQRVSDTVAILNKGELIASAPIEELLAGGNKGAAYTITVKGNAEGARQRLSGQSWVTAVNEISRNGSIKWQVSVSDEDAAERQLVSLVQENGDVRVSEYGRKKYDLEEVFLNIVGGDNNGR